MNFTKNSLPPSAEREKIEKEIAVTDERIDEIVYGLYGVTEKERKITERNKHISAYLTDGIKNGVTVYEAD